MCIRDRGTDAPIDSSAVATSGTNSITATNASFAAGQIILVHQTRGTNAGLWEENQIASYVAGTITTTQVLVNSYATSGADAAQVLVIPQYSSCTVSSTLTAKAWNGTVGGILALRARNTLTISTTTTASGKGYRGGVGVNNSGTTGQAWCGEGTVGASAQQYTANGNGGGGGKGDDAQGGGGGHFASGGTGNGGTVAGIGGGTAGSADLVTCVFGGGGGGSSDFQNEVAFDGGIGGGWIYLAAPIIIETSGAVVSNGSDGGGGGGGGGTAAGSGAGGSILRRGKTITLGTSSTATGGAQIANTSGRYGGAGGTGRERCEACTTPSGTTNPTFSDGTSTTFTYCIAVFASML